VGGADVKVNLLLDSPSGALPGHLNLDPLAPAGDASRTPCDPTDLSPYVDAGEAQELLAHDVLDHVQLPRADAVLAHWASRLAHGGTLTVSCVDMMAVAHALADRTLSPEDAALLLHGEQRRGWDYRHSGRTLAQLARGLEGLGLQVLRKRTAGLRAVVVARRP
jgi:hypothetical protein